MKKILAKIVQYKELIGAASTAVALVAAVIAWVFAYFATQSQVLYLECRINNDILTQRLPINTAISTASIEWRLMQIRYLIPQKTPEAITVTNQLLTDVDALQKKQAAEAEEFKKRIDEMAHQCSKELRTQEATKRP